MQIDGASFWLEQEDGDKKLAIAAAPGDPRLAGYEGSHQVLFDRYTLKLCPTNAENAAALRQTLPWLQPVPLGISASIGMGDRLGLATPGHVRSLRRMLDQSSDRKMAPIFAQQSQREMTRTGRTPIAVLNDATWGAFQAGWTAPLGADADHCKTTEDIDDTVAAGYSLYTIDPGQYVDSAASHLSRSDLQLKYDALPWKQLESTGPDLLARLDRTTVSLERQAISLEAEALTRAAVKYGGAIAHVVHLYRHLMSKSSSAELEISVDETETPTSHVEHIYIAGELQRLGVRWVSLAPRYVGRFEKGVDFIGSLDALRTDLAGHAAIARTFGQYKLSLHSGSDKFTVYPLIRDATQGAVHLKTAGTSYLEALRIVAVEDPLLFRTILEFARAHYEEDRRSYQVSAELGRVPRLDTVHDDRLYKLLDQFDARQLAHVTFGSTMANFGPRVLALLRAHEAAYLTGIERHFTRHLQPFLPPSEPLSTSVGQ